MSQAQLKINVQEGGLAAGAKAAFGVFGAVGVCALVEPGIRAFTETTAAREALGPGPLCDLVTSALSQAKTTVYTVSLAGSIAGTVNNITPGETNTGTGTLTTKGSPRNRYAVKITIKTTGALNAGTFFYTVDGAESEELTLPEDGKFPLPETGLELNFSATEWITGDTFTFTTTAPTASNQETLEGVDRLINSPYQLEFIAVAGVSAAPLWSALAVKMDLAAQNHRFLFCICQARYLETGETVDAWTAALITDERGMVLSKRLMVCASWINEADTRTGQNDERPLIGLLCGLIAKRGPHEPIDATKYGPIPSAASLLPDGINQGHSDALDNSGYCTACAYSAEIGLYITHGRMMSAENSDFRNLERVRVVNRACEVVRRVQFQYLNDNVELGVDGSPVGLEMFRALSEQPLEAMKKAGQISGYSLEIPEDLDLLATEKVDCTIKITPLGKIGEIETTISYNNPKKEGK